MPKQTTCKNIHKYYWSQRYYISGKAEYRIRVDPGSITFIHFPKVLDSEFTRPSTAVWHSQISDVGDFGIRGISIPPFPPRAASPPTLGEGRWGGEAYLAAPAETTSEHLHPDLR